MRKRILAAFLLAAAAAPLQAYALSASTVAATGAEESLFRAVNSGATSEFMDKLMPLLTDIDRWRIPLALAWAALLIFGKRRARTAAILLIPLVAASDQITSSLIKPLAARLRPCEVLGGVHLWLKGTGWMVTPAEVTRSYKSSFSFPSSHAANITAAALFLGLVYRRWLVPLLALALAVSYSRIYTGVHWPSDVITGIGIGALLAIAALYVHRRIRGESGQDKPPSTKGGRAAGPPGERRQAGSG